MTVTTMLRYSMFGALGLAICPVATADNCNGRWSNVTVAAETLEVASGHSVTYFHARGTVTSDNSPLNAVGMCGGYVLSMPDGKVRAVGVCARKTKDGDSFSDEWSIEPGAERVSGGSRLGPGCLQASPTMAGGSPWQPMARRRRASGVETAGSSAGIPDQTGGTHKYVEQWKDV